MYAPFQLSFDFDALENEVTLEVTETSAVVAVATAPAAPKVLEFMLAHGHLGKMTDVVLKKCGIFKEHSLRSLCTSAIHAKWMEYAVKDGFDFDQVCQYAYDLGKTAVLDERRGMGYAVKLPSTLFRPSMQGKSKVAEKFALQSIGAVECPMDIDDHVDNAELAYEDDYTNRYATESEVFKRVAALGLTAGQLAIAKQVCVDGLTADEIAADLAEASPVTDAQIQKLLSKHADAVAAGTYDYADALDEATALNIRRKKAYVTKVIESLTEDLVGGDARLAA